MITYSTACPRNCYSTCSFKVLVDNNRIVGFEPQPANRATPEGPCIKGLSYFERACSKDRILFPMKRTAVGSFERISWDDALGEISSRLKKYRDKFGSHSILFYAASGMAGLVTEFSSNFWDLFGGVTTTYGNLCWPAGLEAVRLTLGENKHNAPWDLKNAKLIVLWGKNPAETNIHQMVFIEEAQQNSAQVIVVDPRRTESSERADLLIQPRPGTDGALALGIANILIEQNWIDSDFLEKHVFRFEQFKTAVADWSLEKTAKVTDVPPHFISQFAKAIGAIKPMTLVPGYGMQRYTNGGQTIRCILALSILTGNIGKPGACFHYADLQSYVFDSVKEPLSYYPDVFPNPKFRRTIGMATLGKDMLNATNPPLKMIWAERGNPLAQNPDTNRVREAFRRLEFRVVTEQFLTDTAAEADIILPAKNMFEQSDIVGSYWNPYVQLKPKVLEPRGEVKPESEIYYLLGKKLGFSDDDGRQFLPAPGDDKIETFLKNKVKKFPELDWDELKEKPAMAPGHEDVPFSDFNFKTPSGKIELYSETAAGKWGVDPLPDFREIAESAHAKYPLQLLSPNSKNRIHSQFGNLDLIKQFEGNSFVVMHIADASARGLEDGDAVRIFNDRGEVRTTVKIDYSLKKGCVVYYNGWWKSEGGSPNNLSEGRITDMGYGAAFHDNAVEVEKLP